MGNTDIFFLILYLTTPEISLAMNLCHPKTTTWLQCSVSNDLFMQGHYQVKISVASLHPAVDRLE